MMILFTKIGIAFATGVALWLSSHMFDRWFRGHTTKQMIAAFKTEGMDSSVWLLADFVVSSWSALTEEVCYRLWLLLLPQQVFWPLAIITSVTFAWRHYAEFKRPIFFFLCGVVFCLLLVYVGWWASLIAHLVFNICGVAYAVWLLRRVGISFLLPSDGR